jgi:hypothetical protein
MTDERTFTLRRVGQARSDFAIIEDQLETIYASSRGRRRGWSWRGRR